MSEKTSEKTSEEHLLCVRSAAQEFLRVVGEAGDAGVSQALILPMLLEIMSASGISLPSFQGLSQ